MSENLIQKIKIKDVEYELGTTIDNVSGLQTVLDSFATEDYVDDKIAAIPTPDVSGQINTHNTNTSAHNDIRNLISGLTTRLNTLADSDDATLDQMSEIVAYIKSNKTLIEEVTTNKVNVSDIIDNLTTNVSNKPLSAAQGVALKALIDTIQTAVNAKAAASDLTSHTDSTSNPHSVTKAQVGLGNVDNVKQYSASNPPPYPVTSVNGATGDITISAVPTCSTSNNGQFLRVVSGVPAWSTIPNAEEATF